MNNKEEIIGKLKELREIFTSNVEDIDLPKSALVLLKFNRNRILYDNIIRQKLFSKLRYEAEKTFDLYCAKIGINPETFLEDPAVKMEEIEKKFVEISATPMEEKERIKGKRPDHDSLPDDVRSLFQVNMDAYLRMRKVHEALKNMDGAKACDRYPYIKEFIELDDLTVKNWKAYDSYVAGSEHKQKTIDIDTKRISANRKYVSDNKEKLSKLIAEKSPKTEKLRAEMEKRVRELLSVDAGISNEQLSELAKLGINV